MNPRNCTFTSRSEKAKGAGCTITLSIPNDFENQVTAFLHTHYAKQVLQDTVVVIEDDHTLAGRLAEVDRVRYAGRDRVPEVVFAKAAETGLYISRSPVYIEGRIELSQYFQQQVIYDNYHRYGNLGERSFD